MLKLVKRFMCLKESRQTRMAWSGAITERKMRMWVNGSPRLAQPYRESAKVLLDTTIVIIHPTMQKQGTVVGGFSLIHRSAFVGPRYSRLGPWK